VEHCSDLVSSIAVFKQGDCGKHIRLLAFALFMQEFKK